MSSVAATAGVVGLSGGQDRSGQDRRGLPGPVGGPSLFKLVVGPRGGRCAIGHKVERLGRKAWAY